MEKSACLWEINRIAEVIHTLTLQASTLQSYLCSQQDALPASTAKCVMDAHNGLIICFSSPVSIAHCIWQSICHSLVTVAFIRHCSILYLFSLKHSDTDLLFGSRLAARPPQMEKIHNLALFVRDGRNSYFPLSVRLPE